MKNIQHITGYTEYTNIIETLVIRPESMKQVNIETNGQGSGAPLLHHCTVGTTRDENEHFSWLLRQAG